MNSVRRVAKNTVALSTTSAVRIALAMVLQVFVARRLGASGLGKYAVVLAFVAIFQVISELGLPQLVIRELAGKREAASRRYFYGAVVVHCAASGAAYLLLALTVRVLNYPPDTSLAIMIAGLSLFPHAITATCEACFQAMERMELITGVETAGSLAQLGLSVGLLTAGYGVEALAAVIVAGELIVAVLCLILAQRQGFLRPAQFDLVFSWRLARSTPEFTLLAVSVVISSRLGVIMISKLLGEQAAGIYNAAYLVVRAFSLVAVGYSDAIYPALSRLWRSDASARDRLMMAGRKSLQYGLIVTLPAAAGIAALAPELIRLIYQSAQYEMAVLVLRLVIWEIVPFLGSAVLSRLLIASNLQRLSVRVAITKLGVSIILYGVLILRFGLPGAAVASVLSAGTGMVLNWHYATRHVLALSLRQLILKPLVATGGMVVVLPAGRLWLLARPTWPLWVSIPLGAAVYLGLLVRLRAFSQEDWQFMRSLVRGASPLPPGWSGSAPGQAPGPCGAGGRTGGQGDGETGGRGGSR